MGNIVKRITPASLDSMQATTNMQAQSEAKNKIYNLVQPPARYNLAERGILVDEAARAFQTRNYAKLREVIKENFKEYLYDDTGECRDISIKLLIEGRNTERKQQVLQKNEKKSIFQSQLSIPDEYSYTGKGTRKCCWDVDKRGALGETALHVCFLNNTIVHNLLAKQIINVFPNMLHDIYLGDEYYGENCLHMAIANEDIEMVNFIMRVSKQHKIELNIQERCCGKFFCPYDQKQTRRDMPDSEIVDVASTTDYKGLVYWGEYPLSFAACSNQKDVVRLLLKKGADLFAKDNNGNNVLHMMVIHNNKEMFDFCYQNAQPDMQDDFLEKRNKQGLTPLTLAAKLANKAMLDHILELKRDIAWVFGDVTCAHYPLSDIDTINPNDGSINNQSALSIILSEKSVEHLSMLDGLLYQLLHEKWKQYAKVRFYQRGALFLLYLGFFITAIYLQPLPPQVSDSCYLQNASDGAQITRLVFEAIVVAGATAYLVLAALEVYNEGFRTFLHTIYNAPMKGSFLISCVFVLSVIPCRYTCSLAAENVLLTIAICTCVPYLLFFCRGFKLVGPFIVAIYNMITGDLLRFLIIYLIFLMGFSQAMYVIFRGSGHELFSHPFQSVMGMFVITLGEFGDLYIEFDQARHPLAAKMLFFVFMILVTVLLINVLIAMMGNTFNKIAETRWEWQRQWAKIVLVMEQSVTPYHRKRKQRRYSQPVHNKKGRWFVIRNFKETKGQEA
ncbi:unnamed protein product [Clavelina lepadiformis]|uniref:Ion transport domain-containing protein n=2 Tax=Clavelina lepadiformis TaxID=159417 RepID=A0ABP0FUV6_CLALP